MAIKIKSEWRDKKKEMWFVRVNAQRHNFEQARTKFSRFHVYFAILMGAYFATRFCENFIF